MKKLKHLLVLFFIAIFQNLTSQEGVKNFKVINDTNEALEIVLFSPSNIEGQPSIYRIKRLSTKSPIFGTTKKLKLSATEDYFFINHNIHYTGLINYPRYTVKASPVIKIENNAVYKVEKKGKPLVNPYFNIKKLN